MGVGGPRLGHGNPKWVVEGNCGSPGLVLEGPEWVVEANCGSPDRAMEGPEWVTQENEWVMQVTESRPTVVALSQGQLW